MSDWSGEDESKAQEDSPWGRLSRKLLRVTQKTANAVGIATPFGKAIKLVKYNDMKDRFGGCRERGHDVPTCVGAEVLNQTVRTGIQIAGVAATSAGATAVAAPTGVTQVIGAAAASAGGQLIFDADDYGNAVAETVMKFNPPSQPSKPEVPPCEDPPRSPPLPFHSYDPANHIHEIEEEKMELEEIEEMKIEDGYARVYIEEPGEAPEILRRVTDRLLEEGHQVDHARPAYLGEYETFQETCEAYAMVPSDEMAHHVSALVREEDHRLTVYQDRMDNISRHLVKWRDASAKPLPEAAIRPASDFCPEGERRTYAHAGQSRALTQPFYFDKVADPPPPPPGRQASLRGGNGGGGGFWVMIPLATIPLLGGCLIM